jgi:drug/metabolite transporter (DMT)-like permease
LVPAYSGLIALSVVWGLAFVAIKALVSSLSPVNLALMRWLIASVLFLALVPVIGRPRTRFERKDTPRLLFVAFATVPAYNLSLFYAETNVSAGLAGLLNAFGPVFMVVLSVVVLDEKVTTRVLVALFLAFLGTVTISLGTISLGDLGSFVGLGEMILSAVFYALFTVEGRPLVQKYGGPPTMIWSGLLGTVMMVPLLSRSFLPQFESLSLVGWASVLYLSALVTVFGYVLFFTILSRGAVSRLSIQLYLVPAVSVAGGALLLGEPVTTTMVVGGAVILVAVALATRGRGQNGTKP